MAKLNNKKLDFDWAELVITDKDWNEQSPAMLRSMLQQLQKPGRFPIFIVDGGLGLDSLATCQEQPGWSYRDVHIT